jgi:hypothetical protein
MYGDDADAQQIQDWLNSLRDGTHSEKIAARRSLARVFERRGMLEEAVELLENNVRAGVRSGETFRWLSRLYREQGDEARSEEALAEAMKYLAVPVASVPSSPTDRPIVPTPSRPIRTPARYLLMILALGIVIGAVLWLVAPLLRP